MSIHSLTARFSCLLSSRQNEYEGVLWMIIAAFFFSAMAILIHHVSQTVHPLEIVFYRSFFSLILLIPWVTGHGFKKVHQRFSSLHLYRSFSAVIGMSLFFYGLAHIPTTEAIALSFTAPLLTTLMAIWLLKEKVSLQGWIALLIGFFGVLVILRPGTESFEWISGVILLAALCWAFSNVLVKKLSHSDHPKGIVWLSGVLTLPLSLPLAIFFWSEIAWSDMAWLLLLAWLSNQAQFSITRAYSKAPIALLQPFDFCRLIFISLFVYILFGEQPDLWTWVGAIIILSSGVYIIRQTSNEKRRRLLVENLQKL